MKAIWALLILGFTSLVGYIFNRYEPKHKYQPRHKA